MNGDGNPNDAPRAPRNRQELVEALDRVRVEGIIDEAEEGRLLRQYDELQRDYEAAVARAEPEYRRRVEEDGQQAADQWLKQTATTLGRQAGESIKRITDQLHVVTG